MIELLLIGIGTGDPDHVTQAAIKAMNRADLVLIPRKGCRKTDLADLRREICARYLTNPATRLVEFDLPVRDAQNETYTGGVNDWHDAIAATYRGLVAAHLGGGGALALLVWGDPSLYDSSLRIAGRLRASGVELTVTVIPGVTSLQMLTAAHAIPLNTLAEPFLVTTGRRLRETGWPDGVDTVVVMLDGDCAFQTLPPGDFQIWWGAYVGMPEQILDHGPLAEAGPRILLARAAARAEHGWIMDIYLLRRSA